MFIALLFLDHTHLGVKYLNMSSEKQFRRDCLYLGHRMKGQKVFSPPGGLEPPTFRLTAERASRLRHGGLYCRNVNIVMSFDNTDVSGMTII